MILPRVRSYGDSSSMTLSPGRMRIKFILIFPETCAKTLCWFVSSTRNIAFGSDSVTVPSTWTASSFGILFGDYLRFILPHKDGLLKMPGPFPILCHDRPTVLQHLYLVPPCVQHWLNRQGHAFDKLEALVRLSEIRHLRFFMKAPANAVSDMLPHDRKPLFFRKTLHGPKNVRQPVSFHGLRNSR